ncbi:hypothetical protein NN561_007875 [Cricetulus griseus]
MSRNEAPPPHPPGRAQNRQPRLTCCGACLQYGGEQRGGDDGEQPPRALALRRPPERSDGREGEEAAEQRGHGAGTPGASPTWVPWCSRLTPAPLRPRNKGGARRRRRDPGCRPPAPESPAH